MAKDSEKVFEFIRKLLSGGGPPPTKTAICQALIADRIVGSMGTAHKYVGAFFAADAMRAEFRAPESDVSLLPDRVRSAFESLVAASDALRNEIVAAIDDHVNKSSTTFALMTASHSAAQQTEIEELGIELGSSRNELDALKQRLVEEAQLREAAEAALVQREEAFLEAKASVEFLTARLEAELTRVASLASEIDSKAAIIDALQSERRVLLMHQQLNGLPIDLADRTADAADNVAAPAQGVSSLTVGTT